jgi:RecA/RadA recombinase
MNKEPRKISRDLNKSDKLLLFAWMALSKDLLERANRIKLRELMSDVDSVFAFWLDALNEYLEAYSELPTLEALKAKLFADVTQSLNVDMDDVDVIEHMISTARSMLEKDMRKYEAAINGILSKYAEELIRSNLAGEFSKSLQTAPLVEQLQKAQQDIVAATATNESMFKSVYTDGLDEREAGQFFSLGVDFLDLFAGGSGPGSTDVVGHAGPRGGGKSTLLNQVACNVALAEQAAAAAEGRPPKWCYVITYERIEDPLIHHLTYVGRIDRNAVENFIYTKEQDSFSTGTAYKEYELRMFAKHIAAAKAGRGSWPRAEAERFNAARIKLSTNLCVADFTGRDEVLAQFSGKKVPGIAQYVALHQRSVNNPGVAGVFIDYAGTCVRAALAETNASGDRERQWIEDLPLQAKRLLANKYLTFVWIAHQLAAQEASRKPGTAPDKNAFKSAKSFAENCDFCIVNGTLTADGLAVFGQSKARRGEPLPDMPGRLDAVRCRWVSAGSNFVVHDNRAMTRAEASVLGANLTSKVGENYD